MVRTSISTRNLGASGSLAPVTTSRQVSMIALAGRVRPRVFLCLASALVASCQTVPTGGPLAAVPTAAPDASTEARIRAIVAEMTLEQKVGQITQAEIRSITPDEVRQYYIGSVLNGGGAWPAMNMHAGVGDWLQLADGYYRAATATAIAGPKSPLAR